MGELILHLVLWLWGFWLLWRIPVCVRQHPSARQSPGKAGTPAFPALSASVIVPARNEERRLPELLQSLAIQSLRPHEILVVDDCSTDSTSSVARDWGASVVQGSERPESWVGKTWPCWNGARASTGSVLVFLDADTILAPDGLESLVREYQRSRGLISVQPYHITVRIYEQLSAFLNVVLMMGSSAFTPLGRRIATEFAFGPCIVCSREDYFTVGGHEAVRGLVLEHAGMGKLFARAGLPVRCFGGRGTISFRMYPEGVGQMVDGWSKSFASGALSIRIPTLVLIVGWITGCVGTAVNMIRALLHHGLPSGFSRRMVASTLLYAAYSTQTGWMLHRIGRFRWWTAPLFPLPLLAFIAVFTRSSLLTLVVGRVRWKDRDIRTRT